MGGLVERLQITPRPIFFLVGCLLTAFYFFTSYDSGTTIDSQIASINKEIQQSQDELTAASKVAAEKGKFQEEVTFVSEQLQAAFAYLPPNLDTQDVVKKISTEARYAGVNLSRIKPLKPESQDFYEELLMEVELEGSFSQLTMFLSGISHLERIISIRNLNLRKSVPNDPSSPLLKMQGQLVAYRYDEKKSNENAKDAKDPKNAQNAKPTPGAKK